MDLSLENITPPTMYASLLSTSSDCAEPQSCALGAGRHLTSNIPSCVCSHPLLASAAARKCHAPHGVADQWAHTSARPSTPRHAHISAPVHQARAPPPAWPQNPHLHSPCLTLRQRVASRSCSVDPDPFFVFPQRKAK